MPRHLPADPAFRGLLLAVLCAACGPKSTPETSGQSEPATDTPSEPARLPGVGLGGVDEPSSDVPLVAADLFTFAPTVTGLALVEEREGMQQKSRTVLGQSADICTSEDCSEHTALIEAGDAIRRECGQIGCVDWTLIARTDGGELMRIDSSDALVTSLGSIDTPAEARLLAWSKGFDVATMPVEKDGRFAVTAREHISDCPVQVDDVTLAIAADGTVEEVARTENPTSMCVGRLAPIDHAPSTPPSTVGEWLAQAACMEAESAIAFRVLAAELVEHGAPSSLVSACMAAAEDEDRHARLVAEQAARYGGVVCWPEASDVACRSLDAIAVDNAAEGLAREVWGTLLAFWQARHAPDEGLRDVFGAIALDEARHAELSRALHAWLLPRLDAVTPTQLAAIRSDVWQQVASGTGELPPHLRRDLGLPRSPSKLAEEANSIGLAA